MKIMKWTLYHENETTKWTLLHENEVQSGGFTMKMESTK